MKNIMDTESLPEIFTRNIFIFCKDCGREFVYKWKKGTTKPRYCGSCKITRRKNSKEKHRKLTKGGK